MCKRGQTHLFVFNVIRGVKTQCRSRAKTKTKTFPGEGKGKKEEGKGLKEGEMDDPSVR